MRRHAPAALRNREPIAEVLRRELPMNGLVLEIASGSGEHAVHFAEQFPALEWQPSDPDPQALASIAAYRDERAQANLRLPVALDASDPKNWIVANADAILCINMTHISPWSATEGLFRGAERVLSEPHNPLILYGPYLETDIETTPSNLAFDESLRARNSQWGIRDLGKVDALAQSCGFARKARLAMPANNLMLVYRKG